jgi:hypothetical protein
MSAFLASATNRIVSGARSVHAGVPVAVGTVILVLSEAGWLRDDEFARELRAAL